LELFPELNATMHPAFKQITLEQLLSHHAGIPPYDRPKTLPKLSGSAVEQRSRFVALALNQAPATTPGTKALYSNGGFVIAAAMAERSTGSSWEELVTSQVLKPLGMHAIFAFPLSADINQPWGHAETKEGIRALDQFDGAAQVPLYLLPAGGMAMALGDYGKFLQMNLKGLRGENNGFLSAKTIQRLHSSTMQDEYALGWGLFQMNGVTSSTHAGSAGSFYAIVALQPSRDEGVAVVLNSAGERTSQVAAASLKALLTRYAAAPQDMD
jgi:D-alanyl-D-alanine carboxypeptidase